MGNQDAGGSYAIDSTGARVLVERTQQQHEVNQAVDQPVSVQPLPEQSTEELQDRNKKPRS